MYDLPDDKRNLRIPNHLTASFDLQHTMSLLIHTLSFFTQQEACTYIGNSCIYVRAWHVTDESTA